MNDKFYWIKLRTDFFKDDSPMDFLLGMPNGSEYVALYIKLCLSAVNTDGKLCNTFGEMIVPYNIEKIQRDMKHFSIDTVRVAMELYKRMGLIYEEDDGILRITNYEGLVGSEGSSAERMRNKRIRDKERAALSVKTSQCDTQSDSLCDIEIRDKSIDIRDIENRDIDTREESKKKNTSSTLASASEVYFPEDELLNNAFLEFVKMRKAIKKPLTIRAAELARKKLLDMSHGDNDLAIAICEQSVLKSWQDFYPLKNTNTTPHKELTMAEKLMAVALEMENEDGENGCS